MHTNYLTAEELSGIKNVFTIKNKNRTAQKQLTANWLMAWHIKY